MNEVEALLLLTGLVGKQRGKANKHQYERYLRALQVLRPIASQPAGWLHSEDDGFIVVHGT
jgi:hypothetical protein